MQNRNELANGCGGKRQYPNNAAAVQAAISLHNRASRGKPNAYYCAVCGSFHIGRKGMKPKPRTTESEPMLLEKFRGKTASEITEKTFGENRELSWLAQRVARGQKEPFSEIATITPSIAKHILERNDDNRHLRQNLVDQIAADINDGLWQLNGESIVISRDGILNDGQHRLNAIIQSGKSVRTAIMFGVSRESRITVDMGTARQAADLLGMTGTQYSTCASGCARTLKLFHEGIFNTSQRIPGPTKQQTVAYYNANRKAIDKASAFVSNDAFFKKHSVTAWAAAHVLLNKIDPDSSALFFHKAASGENLKRGDAILTLRLHCMEARGEFRKPAEWLEMILRYWLAWKDNRQLARRLTMHKQYPIIGA